jgi:anti-anti-sigma regulatory factor
MSAFWVEISEHRYRTVIAATLLVIDLAKVTHMDPAEYAALTRLRVAAGPLGKGLLVSHVPNRIRPVNPAVRPLPRPQPRRGVSVAAK